MAQGNPFDQFDRAPVPVSQIKPIIAAPTDPYAADREARAQVDQALQIEAAARAREDQRRQAEEADRKRREWEATHNPDGSPKTAGSGSLDPKTQEGMKNIASGILKNTGVNLQTGDDPVSDLILRSTSGSGQKMAAEIYGNLTGTPTEGMKAIAALRPILADMTLQMAGGSLGANISDGDRKFIMERMGNIADPSVTAEERLASWDQVKRRLAQMSGIEMPAPPQDTGDEQGLVGTVTDTSPSDPRLSDIGRGVMQGLGSMAEGAGDIVGIVGNPLNATINAALGTNLSTDLGTSAREMLGLPENQNPLAGAIIRGGTGAMTSAGVAGGLARALPGAAGRAASAMAAQPVQQVAGGMGAGGGAEIARQQGGGPVAQVGAALLGGVAGSGVAGITKALAAPRVATPAAVAAAERAGIPVMTSDVAPPQTFMGKAAQTAGERVPIAGTGGVRAAQQNARVQAVKDVLAEYGAGTEGLPDKVWNNLAATRSATLTKYTNMKNDVIAALDGAGDVPVTNTTAAIDKEIAHLSRLSPKGFAPAIAILRRWRSDLQGKSLADIEILRKQVGEEFSAPELSAVSSVAQKSLNRIYAPLRNEMTEFIRANGGAKDATKWMVANKRLSEAAGELDKTSLKSVLRSGDVTPEAVNNLLFSQKRSDVAALYRNLTPEGRANARAAIMDKVFKDMGGDLDAVSPEKFIAEVRKQGTAIGVMFDQAEADRIHGLVKALKLTKRGGEAGVMTNTGQQVAPIAGLTGLATLVSGIMGQSAATGASTGLATIGAAGTIGMLARAMESKAARAALMQLRNAKPAEEAAAAKRFIAAINATEPR